MTDKQIKAAENRGYCKGYRAGKNRKQREINLERKRHERQAFLDRAFLAVLPVAMNSQGWSFGEIPVASTDDRVKLACYWANEALNKRPLA